MQISTSWVHQFAPIGAKWCKWCVHHAPAPSSLYREGAWCIQLVHFYKLVQGTCKFLQLGKTGGKMGFESRSLNIATAKTIGALLVLFVVAPASFWLFIFWLLGAFD